MTTPADVAIALQRAGPRLLEGERQLLQDMEIRLSRTDFRGLAIVSAAQIGTDRERELPLVVATQKTVLRAWEVMEDENLMFAAIDRDTGEVTMARAASDPKADERGGGLTSRPPKPTGLGATAIVTGVERHDVRDRLKLPWREGSIALCAIEFDWISNVVRIELSGATARPRPSRRTISPLPAVAGQALPSFDPTPHHPPLPTKGVAFRIQPTQAGSFVMLGAYAKALAAADILPAPQTLHTAAGAKTAVAAVQMTLAVVGLDQRIPGIVSWSLPVYGTTAPAPGQPASGHLAIDLGNAGVIAGPGHYAAYVFMDADVYGPQRFDVR